MRPIAWQYPEALSLRSAGTHAERTYRTEWGWGQICCWLILGHLPCLFEAAIDLASALQGAVHDTMMGMRAMACVFVWGGARSGRVAVPTELWHQKGPRAVGASRGRDAGATRAMETQRRVMTTRRPVVWISHRTRKRFLTPFLLSVIEDQEVIKTILKHLARIIHEEVNIRPPGFDSAHVCGASLRARTLAGHTKTPAKGQCATRRISDRSFRYTDPARCRIPLPRP